MAKFNHPSPAALLGSIFPSFESLRLGYFSWNKYDSNRQVLNHGVKEYMLYIVQNNSPKKKETVAEEDLNRFSTSSWRKIRKDLTDIGSPYKSTYHMKADLLQLMRGIGNIVNGLCNLILLPILPLLFLQAQRKIAKNENLLLTTDKSKLVLSLSKRYALANCIYCLGQILRGIIQIITFIPNMFLRIPLRLLLTKYRHKGNIWQSRSLLANMDALDLCQKNKYAFSLCYNKILGKLHKAVIREEYAGATLTINRPIEIFKRISFQDKLMLGVMFSEENKFNRDSSEFLSSICLKSLEEYTDTDPYKEAAGTVRNLREKLRDNNISTGLQPMP